MEEPLGCAAGARLGKRKVTLNSVEESSKF